MGLLSNLIILKGVFISGSTSLCMIFVLSPESSFTLLPFYSLIFFCSIVQHCYLSHGDPPLNNNEKGIPHALPSPVAIFLDGTFDGIPLELIDYHLLFN